MPRKPIVTAFGPVAPLLTQPWRKPPPENETTTVASMLNHEDHIGKTISLTVQDATITGQLVEIHRDYVSVHAAGAANPQRILSGLTLTLGSGYQVDIYRPATIVTIHD